MRLIRILIAMAIVALVPVLTASAAHAAIAGPCTASGQVTVNAIPKTPVINPATTNSAKIPERASCTGRGPTGSGNRTISGKVDIKLPPPFGKVEDQGVGVASRGDTRTAGTYKYNLPSLLLGLKVPVSGRTASPGSRAAGTITVQISGSTDQEPGTDRVAGAHVPLAPQHGLRVAGEAADAARAPDPGVLRRTFPRASSSTSTSRSPVWSSRQRRAHDHPARVVGDRPDPGPVGADRSLAYQDSAPAQSPAAARGLARARSDRGQHDPVGSGAVVTPPPVPPVDPATPPAPPASDDLPPPPPPPTPSI